MSQPKAAGFPPEQHVISDLAMTSERIAEGRNVTVAPLPDGVRDRAGRPSVGLLATLADCVAAGVVLPAVTPDWTSTADLSVHAAARPVTGPLVADARLVRAGSRLVVARVAVHDAAGRLADDVLDELVASPEAAAPGATVAEVLLSFVRMPSSRSRVGSIDPTTAFTRRAVGPDDPPAEPLAERVEIRPVDGTSGAVEVGNGEYVRNSMGSITGGVHAIAMQAAAEAAEPSLVANGVEIRFLSQAKVGPIRATARPVRSSADHAVHVVEVVDQGNDRLVSIGTVTLDQP